MSQIAQQQNPAAGAIARRLSATMGAIPMQAAPPINTDPMAPAAGNNATPPQPVSQNSSIQQEAMAARGEINGTGGMVPTIPVSKVHFTPPNPLAGGTGDTGLDKYLGTDSAYQSQLSELMKQYDDYNAQKNLQASQTQADYDAKMKAMNTQTAQDQLNMRNAAAARGILQSGIYANQLGQYNDASQQQMTNLLGGLQNARDTSNLAYTQEVDQLEAAKQNAIQQAAARRAASLGTF